MKIAILGTRGIPANYSGLEACVEETATRLAQRDYDITVYCRGQKDQLQPSEYKGVHLIWLPIVRSKHGETILHTLMSFLHVIRNFDRRTVIHLYGVGNAPFLVVFKVLGYSTLISVDGQDWRRAKWGRFASAYLRLSAKIAAMFSRYCIVDSQVVETYYKKTFGTSNIRYIPYGHTEDASNTSSDILGQIGIRSKEYVLFVGRIVPEKGVHYLLQAYKQVSTDKPLVIVGAIQDPDYAKELQQLASPNIIFAGPIYGQDAAALYQNAYLYVHPSDVDGTSHALLSAMGSGLTPLVSNIPENLETIGDVGFSFRQGDVEDLASRLRMLLPQPELLAQVGRAAQRRIQQCYNWDHVTNQLEQLYQSM